MFRVFSPPFEITKSPNVYEITNSFDSVISSEARIQNQQCRDSIPRDGISNKFHEMPAVGFDLGSDWLEGCPSNQLDCDGDCLL